RTRSDAPAGSDPPTTRGNGSTWIEKVRLPTKMTRLERRIGAFGEPVIQGQDVELGGLRHEPILKVAGLLRVLGSEIVRLREVFFDVVEFPAVLVERYAAAVIHGALPWRHPATHPSW